MSKILRVGLLLAVLVFVASPAAAETLHRSLYQGVAAITSPEAFASVRGNVSITGTAVHPQFQRYELYFTVEPGENWVFIGEAHREQVQNGLLGTWNTGSLPDGTYSLRLRVVRQDGNYDEAIQRGIVVANSTPPTPTPTSTPAVPPTLPPATGPTATPTVEATPTAVLVEQPEIPTPTPRPSPTPTEEAQAPVVEQIDGQGDFFSETFDANALRDAFGEGLTYAGAAFLAVGAFFGVKRLLLWLWYLIAP